MPRIRMRDGGGTLRTITRIRMRDAAGTLRTISQIRMRDGSGTLRTVFSSFSVVLDEVNVYTFATPPGTITSTTINSTVTGGVSPYTYLWERVSGSGSISAASPTAANTAFQTTMAGGSGYRTAVFRLKVTDNVGEIKYSPEIIVEMEWA